MDLEVGRHQSRSVTGGDGGSYASNMSVLLGREFVWFETSEGL